MAVVPRPASPTATPTSETPAPSTRRSVRLQLTIFTGVTVALLLTWLCLSLAGVKLHNTLWISIVVMVLWLGRILMVERRASGKRAVTGDQIEHGTRKTR